MVVGDGQARTLGAQWMEELLAAERTIPAEGVRFAANRCAQGMIIAMAAAPHAFQARVALSEAFPVLAREHGPLLMIKAANLLAKIGAVTITRPERPPIKIMLGISPPGPFDVPIAGAAQAPTGDRVVSLTDSRAKFDEWGARFAELRLSVPMANLPDVRRAITLLVEMAKHPDEFQEARPVEAGDRLAVRYLRDVGVVVLNTTNVVASTTFRLSINPPGSCFA